MKISRQWLQEYFKESLPSNEQLIDGLTFHSCEVEGVEKAGDDTVFDLKVLPDRAHYLLSHQGFAREVAAIFKLKAQHHIIPQLQSSALSPSGALVEIKAETPLCRRYMACRIEGVHVQSSPAWLKTRLEAIGARSINNVVDATNYVMFDTGQPLHAFDADTIVGKLVVRMATAGETIKLLSGQTLSLTSTMMVIADDAGPLAVAGVKGGARAEVTEATKNIIIESANFEPVSVRRTSFAAGIRNDSSKRFENALSPYVAKQGIEEVVSMIVALAGGTVGLTSDYFPQPPVASAVKVGHKELENILGFPVSLSSVMSSLQALGCHVSESGEMLTITPPPERIDLTIPVDIADEVGRMNGYQDIQGIVPKVQQPAPHDTQFLKAEQIKTILYNQGFHEMLTRSFTEKGQVEVLHPMASDKAFLRTTLTAQLMVELEQNVKQAPLYGPATTAIRLFEVGTTFTIVDGKNTEIMTVALGIALTKKQKGVQPGKIIEDALALLGVKTSVKVAGAMAYAEVALDAVQLPKPEPLLGLIRGSRAQFKPYSFEPFIVRDIAVFVPSGIKDEDVFNIIHSAVRTAAGELLVRGPEQFDRFEKDGRVSYAYRMVFQAADRTLADAEANTFIQPAYEALKAQSWEVR
jgi:phenylalanyl-tRNA synthetase beta chain